MIIENYLNSTNVELAKMVKRKFYSHKMSSKTDKKIKAEKENEAEDGEIVEKPSPSNIDRSTKIVTSDLSKEGIKGEESGKVMKTQKKKLRIKNENKSISANAEDDEFENIQEKEEKMKVSEPTLGPRTQKVLKSSNLKDSIKNEPNERFMFSSSSQPAPRFRRKCPDCVAMNVVIKKDLAIMRKNALAREREVKSKVSKLEKSLSQYGDKMIFFEEKILFLESYIKTVEANKELKAENKKLQKKI